MAGVSPDPLAPLVGLPGVEDAVRRARAAVVELHRHPVNRTGWAASAAEAALRAARASAALDGAELARADGVVTDPVLAGAVRAAEATGRLLGTWRTAPLQALARLHVLAAAVVHGELLALEPFPSANGVVSRAAARLAAISSGLDPRGLAVPEVGHLRAGAAYREAARGFAAGTPDGLATWIRHCCDQWVAGAREGRSIADARTK